MKPFRRGKRITSGFDREAYFDMVRDTLFDGSMNDDQVNGQGYILDVWENYKGPLVLDLRWLAYALATAYHECDRKMLPISEYGKGSGHDYGVPDPETGQVYYGRGYVQLTWKENYERATKELGLVGDEDLVWHPDKALDPEIAAQVMFLGMFEGWFRGSKLEDFFNGNTNDAENARDIINGDVAKLGETIAGYHDHFFAALVAASPEDD